MLNLKKISRSSVFQNVPNLMVQCSNWSSLRWLNKYTHTLSIIRWMLFSCLWLIQNISVNCVTVPDVAVSRPVLEEPAVRGLIFPANIASVFPQELHLLGGVARVPQSVPQVFTWTCVWFHCLKKSKKGITCLRSHFVLFFFIID